MPRFKVKELMIDVGQAQPGAVDPGAGLCGVPTVGCLGRIPTIPITPRCWHFPATGGCLGISPCWHFPPTPCWLTPCPQYYSDLVAVCQGVSVDPITPAYTPVINPPIDIQPEDLNILKEQLRQVLGQIEARQSALEESLRPQTLEQVEDLELKLKGALEELQSRKEELQQKAAKPKK